MAYIGLDTTQHERSIGEGAGNQPLPNGFYHSVVTRAELKDVKDNTAHKYLEVEFDITHPAEYGRRKVWEKFNLINGSAVTVKIAKEQLSDLAQCMGMATLNESDDLIGKEIAMVLGIQPATPKKNGGEWPASNKVLKYLPIGATMADYDAWLATKRSDKKGQVPERKAWGSAAPAAQVATSEAPKTKPWASKKA